MILGALRLLGSLSGYHHRTTILTILLPAIGPASLAFFAPESLALQIILYVAAFAVWSDTCCARGSFDAKERQVRSGAAGGTRDRGTVSSGLKTGRGA